LVFSPISIGSLSPRTIAPHQMLEFFRMMTFPITEALGAIQYSPSWGSEGFAAPKE
jgi:hypothetical protein